MTGVMERKVEQVVLDLAGYRAWKDGEAVPLTWGECELLRLMAQAPGSVVSRAKLTTHMEFRRGRTLDVAIHRLRRKLDDHQGRYIETVRKVGYRFNARAASSGAVGG
jgi:two-component system alkaline phosphatase synthesis response regulator PhoP